MPTRRHALLGLSLATGALSAGLGPARAQSTPEAEDARLTAFLDGVFQQQLGESPQGLTQFGSKARYGELDDYTPAADERRLQAAQAALAAMLESFDPAGLSPSGRVSFALFRDQVQRQIEAARFRRHGFLFTSGGGVTSSLPVFLINNHRVDSVADAEAYVARLVAVERVMAEVADDLLGRAADGLVAPAFVYPKTLTDARAVISGQPFAEGPDSPVWADIQTKIGALDADPATRERLLGEARAALTGPFARGYGTIIAALEQAATGVSTNDGVWRLPDGAAYYENRLRNSTTTDLSAEQIHAIGLSEVARLQGEMEVIKTAVGIEGSLQDFFVHLKTDSRFQFPNTAEGREAYLAEARGYVDQVMAIADQWFHRLPVAPLEVRAVEAFRENTASVAFYNRPSADGSRPGIYYVNLKDMTQVLRPQIEAISYHEGAPGHHFQIARAMEQPGLPLFRRFGGYGAYVEGWGLYSERLGKEMGFYSDPYSDFGRLSLELWRSVRLVVDTGLHALRWSREQAIGYFQQNSLLSELDIEREVERYITSPGQATSYKIGQLRILEARDRARDALGERFHIRDFHEVVLGPGAVPLSQLDAQVDGWIASGGGRPA